MALSPAIKRTIIIVNIITYIAIGTGIYIKKMGGIKKILPHKQYAMSELSAGTTRALPKPPVQTAAAPAQKSVAAKSAVPAATAKKPEAIKPTPATAIVNRALLAQLPAHIQETNKLLEEMKVKEKILSFTYFAGMHRDPFMPLTGIDKFLADMKLTADELADLPFGLEAGKKKSSPFTLMGTVTSGTGEPTAIINDQLLYGGDIIDGYEVKEISKRKVVLKKGKREIKLEMPYDGLESETGGM